MTHGEIVEKYHPDPKLDEVDGHFFNGPATIRRKVELCRAQGLRGIGIWELGQDATGSDSLLTLIHGEVTSKAR